MEVRRPSRAGAGAERIDCASLAVITPLLASKSASAAVSSACAGTVPAVVMKVSAPVPASKARRSIPSRRIPVPLESQFRPKLAELFQRDNGIAIYLLHFAAQCSFMTNNIRAVFMPDQQIAMRFPPIAGRNFLIAWGRSQPATV